MSKVKQKLCDVLWPQNCYSSNHEFIKLISTPILLGLMLFLKRCILLKKRKFLCKFCFFVLVNRYILSETSPNVKDSSKISKYNISSLQQGIGLYHCNTTSCRNNFKQCQINSAYIDRSKWTPLWNQDETPTITISIFNTLKVFHQLYLSTFF